MSEVQAAVPAAPAAPAPAAPAEVVAPDSQKTPAESASAPAPENATPEKTTPDPEEKRGSRRFERRISQAIRRAAEARAEADVLRRQLEDLRKPQEPVDSGSPRIQDFDDAEKYAKAVAKYETDKALKKVSSDQQAKTYREQAEKLSATWEEKAERGGSKYEDFDEVVGEMKPTNPLTSAIMHLDNGEEVAYHLGKNLKEAERITSLPPILQVLEVGRLSTKLSAEPTKPKAPSKAPAPIAPVTGTKSTEPTELKPTMDFKDFLKVRNRQLGRGA